MVIAGASTHPGKFGFVSLHNLLSAGYAGNVFATNLEGSPVLGIPTLRSIEDLPENQADLIFVCTPKSANPDLLRSAAAKGITAAFLTSAGYGEAGPEGRRDEDELIELCDELGILLVGPNGQGVVSTPASMCAQIVAPVPAGRFDRCGQSVRQLHLELHELGLRDRCRDLACRLRGQRGRHLGRRLPALLRRGSRDVGRPRLHRRHRGRSIGRRWADRVARHMPVVLVKGGSTSGGARAAASHTGSLATDDATFDGICRQAGVTRAATIEEAFEAAATFATQPLPKGNRVIVMTTAGGWGVVTADAITRHPDLELAVLPDDLLASIDEKLPPRWSRNNPVDLAGGETRDTIPEVMQLIAEHDDVDAIVYLGLGIQSNQARMLRDGRFYPDHGIERIVEYHERQDGRFAQAAHDISVATGKPILTATELAVAFPDNAGPATVRDTGRLCYPSADRAVVALGHLWRRSRYRQRRGLPIT